MYIRMMNHKIRVVGSTYAVYLHKYSVYTWWERIMYVQYNGEGIICSTQRECLCV